jgi:integrase
MSKAVDVWEQELSTKAKGTQGVYRMYFKRFLERWKTTPDELYSMRKEDLESDDTRDHRKTERMVNIQAKEMHEEGLAASTCHTFIKAITFFFRAQGQDLNMRPRDRPRGASNGQSLALVEHMRQMWDYAPTETKLKTRALIALLKDSGLRVSDVVSLNMDDFLNARRVVHDGEEYVVFKPHETTKTGALAYIHIGPEAVEALDLYLKERKAKGLPIEPDTPLFINRANERYERRALSQTFVRLRILLGFDKVTAHSLRKFHTTRLQGEGLNDGWIKLLQGKTISGSMAAYTRPHETGQLTEAYIEAYPMLRIFEEQASTQKLNEQEKQIQSLKEEVEQLRSEKREAEDITTRLEKLVKDLIARVDRIEDKK